jgi:hypothetical protein
MNLKEAIKIHNELQDKEEIKKYCEALNIVVKNLDKKAPIKFYKSSNKNEYFIELPYRRLEINAEGKAVYKKYGYSALYTSLDKKSGGNFCLSLCNCTKQDIENLIEKHIKEDNLELLNN